MNPLSASIIVLYFATNLISSGSHVSSGSDSEQITTLRFERHASPKTPLGIYLKAGKAKTLYCRCPFDKDGKIDASSCGLKPETGNGAPSLEWDRAMPASLFGGSLAGRNEPSCIDNPAATQRGKAPCAKTSKGSGAMETDMHNLFPAVSGVAKTRSGLPFGIASGGKRPFDGCDFKIGAEAVEPAASVRGDIARAYFYMSQTYKVPIMEDYETLLRQWHLADPPDSWELDRNSSIEEAQGNRNPFIDQPELVERIRNFQTFPVAGEERERF